MSPLLWIPIGGVIALVLLWILIYNGLDPVADGLIASFARPGGNVTGVSRMLGETRAKRLELIKTHYRSNANFTMQGLADSQRTVERWRAFAAGGAGGVAAARFRWCAT